MFSLRQCLNVIVKSVILRNLKTDFQTKGLVEESQTAVFPQILTSYITVG